MPNPAPRLLVLSTHPCPCPCPCLPRRTLSSSVKHTTCCVRSRKVALRIYTMRMITASSISHHVIHHHCLHTYVYRHATQPRGPSHIRTRRQGYDIEFGVSSFAFGGAVYYSSSAATAFVSLGLAAGAPGPGGSPIPCHAMPEKELSPDIPPFFLSFLSFRFFRFFASSFRDVATPETPLAHATAK